MMLRKAAMLISDMLIKQTYTTTQTDNSTTEKSAVNCIWPYRAQQKRYRAGSHGVMTLSSHPWWRPVDWVSSGPLQTSPAAAP